MKSGIERAAKTIIITSGIIVGVIIIGGIVTAVWAVPLGSSLPSEGVGRGTI